MVGSYQVNMLGLLNGRIVWLMNFKIVEKDEVLKAFHFQLMYGN